MTVNTHLAPPDVEELLVTWLSELGTAAVIRPAGAPLPFRLIKRIAGADDTITDTAVVSVHTFAADYATASHEARVTHQHMLALKPWQRVTLADDTVVWADSVDTSEGPHWQFYDQQIHRFVATYLIGVRFRRDPLEPPGS